MQTAVELLPELSALMMRDDEWGEWDRQTFIDYVNDDDDHPPYLLPWEERRIGRNGRCYWVDLVTGDVVWAEELDNDVQRIHIPWNTIPPVDEAARAASMASKEPWVNWWRAYLIETNATFFDLANRRWYNKREPHKKSVAWLKGEAKVRELNRNALHAEWERRAVRRASAAAERERVAQERESRSVIV